MRAVLSLVMGLALLAPTPTTPGIVAIGDIHGDLDAFTRSLRAAGLADASGRWVAGSTVLVQTGDFLDRGPDVRAVMDRLMSLEAEATAAGGRVIALLGNHEVMNLVGERRDVSPSAYKAFADDRSGARREAAWEEYQRLVSRLPEQDRKATVYQRGRDEWMDDHPPGYLEYCDAIAPRGRYGTWLRRRDMVATVGGSIFMHAGIAPAKAPQKVSDLNGELRDEIRRFDRFVQRLVDSKRALPSFTLPEIIEVAQQVMQTASDAIESAGAQKRPLDRAAVDVDLIAAAADILKMNGWSAFDPQGPMWYRGFSTLSETASDDVALLLQRYGASRFVTAHTVTSDRRIALRFGGRVILIDTGMLASAFNGRPSALKIDGDALTAIYEDQHLPLSVAPTTGR